MEKYICKGHRTCEERHHCYHAKPHKQTNACKYEVDERDCDCVLSENTKRKQKLQYINTKHN